MKCRNGSKRPPKNRASKNMYGTGVWGKSSGTKRKNRI